MIYIKDASQNPDWDKVHQGGTITGGATSDKVKTGDWRILIPRFIEEKCKQCLLCFPVCADYAIPVKDEKRLDYNFDHCKGCGVCYKVCPFEAITWEKEEK